MTDEGLLAIDVNTHSHAVKFIFAPDAPFDVNEIKAYVEDMSQGRSNEIMIFEGTWLCCYLHRRDGIWTDIAETVRNGV